MKIIADLQIHSKYSRATSPQMNIHTLGKFAETKGLDILGTGDFTHPKHLEDLKSSLKEINGTGLFTDNKTKTAFMLTSEVSLIYYVNGVSKKVHNMIFAPSFEIVDQINEKLSRYGNLSADGRPILTNITCPEFTELVVSISKDAFIIPAHSFTPWFSIFGSKSGFNSVEECFQDQTKNIFAIETGLSADPAMCWNISSLDKFALISNSDAHSPWPWRLGREANVFDIENPTYNKIFDAIKNKDKEKFLYTIECDPNYGKYHLDGHKDCNVSLEPSETKKLNGICPRCKRGLTIGVLSRVEQLADRPVGFVPKNAIPFKTLLPLYEIISHVTGVNALYSKKVTEEHDKIISQFGTELNVLMNVPENELKKITHEKIANAIIKSRNGELKFKPGYDGVYGVPLFEGSFEMQKSGQKGLGEFAKQKF
ncbi:MAG: DNA helicase UvrD [Candidatus Aenigmarchaeota archaeon]|nr:DNA helicase UvrD [Candidatus Aenigmarchaeota archaeon]